MNEKQIAFINKVSLYAIKHHLSTNHKYNSLPYETHLFMVYKYALKYKHLLPNDYTNIIASAWTHDLIEDCRLTYNDLKSDLNEEIAEITYALTNEKGKNRRERANDKYYDGIKAIDGAIFIKVCDRMANVEYSSRSIGSMYGKYHKENFEFVEKLKIDRFKEMFDDLEKMFD